MTGELNRVQVRYTDFKADLEEHPATRDLALSTNAVAVKRSVKNLLLTGTYERRFRPHIGAGLQKYLFENVSPVTAQLIRQAIVTAIENFEPRARLISVRVRVAPDNNSYDASVKFGVVNLPDVVELRHIIARVR